MRSINKNLLLIIILFFSPFLVVDAAPMDPISKNPKTAAAGKKAFSQNREISGIANDINYDITSFIIDETGENISFEGWSYVDHMDNVGGRGGNLRTWIVAYVGDWKKSWHDSIVSSNTNSVSSAGKYYAKLASSDNENLNFFGSRCSSDAGTASAQLDRVNARINNNDVKDKGTPRIGREGIYTIDWCLQHYGVGKVSTWNGDGTASRCVYYNIGFKITIKFDDVINSIGVSAVDGKNVKFRIVSSAMYQQNKDCEKNYKCTGSWSKYYKTDSANLGVYKKACNSIFGQDCSIYNGTGNVDYQASKNFDVDGGIVTRSFKITGLSDKLEVTINNAHPCKNNDCSSRYGTGEGVFRSLSFNGGKYTIDSVTTRNINITGAGGNSFSSRVYGVKVFKRLINPSDGNGNKSGGYWIGENGSGGTKTVYLPASWAKISGGFAMTITKGIQPVDVPDPCNIKCIGDNCKRNLEEGDSECNSVSYTAPSANCTVGSSPTGCGANSYSVKTGDLADSNKNCLYVLDDTYYYRISTNDINSVFLSDGETLRANNSYTVKYNSGSYYFPIKFYSKVEVEQTSSITPNFPIGNGGIVDSGRYFIYSSNVNLNAKWQHANFGDYQKVVYAEVTKNGVTNTVPVNVKLKDGESIYNANYMEVGKIGDSSLYTNLTKSKISALKKDISVSSNTVEFSDSNDANNDVKTKPGVFTCSINDNWSNGEISATCNYTINKAYQKIDNTEDSYSLSYGDYLYASQSPGDNFKITDNAHIGSIYYIPLNLKSNFVFDVKFNDLSFINKFNHTYTGTCNVGYKNKLGQVRYRPIDVKNPFPNGIPSNWTNYNNTYGLSRITERSFKSTSYQTVKVSKLPSGIFDNYGIYASMTDMSKNGTSSVLSIDKLFENGSIKAVQGTNYCNSGEFAFTCDKEIGS